ncbi:sensor domain-containing diguanylate cyclase [Vibrio rumoiensis]|uniref:diguanylate cyclase n=1 Tax=Vibrio rumoiensis 1S-45 TaxID=1188252 RepID=A0A1E5E4J8_9VIBR|nr:sensor domain-containing diguanylate cyclase [Vibrio rumoiensis]OEF27756.1 hypothetical protein A1QC_14395 [Vibrio rumoiensis 1S-45]
MNEFKDILDMHPNPFVVHVNFKPLYANDAFARFSGLESAKEILTMDSLMVLINPEEREDALLRYQLALDNKKTDSKIIAHTDLAGNPVMVEITDKSIMWQGQQALCTYISIVTDTIKKQQHLKRLSEQDALTQIHNRRYILNVLRDIHKDQTVNQYFKAIMDIDYFKKVNDKYGHLAGDKVLLQFTQILQDFTQPEDHLARLGGEEFILLIKSQSKEKVLKRLESIRTSIEQNHFVISDKDTQDELRIQCTLSIGVTALNADDDIDTSYGQADKALYIAKQQGRNQVIMLD